MSAPVSVPAQLTERRGRLWWLPGNGCGNGLDDDAWAPVLEVSRQAVPALLEILREAEIPAYAAPIRPTLARPKEPTPEQAEGYRLYVGTSVYGEAEAVLLAAMPLLTRNAGKIWR
jgi:hypothetical protein